MNRFAPDHAAGSVELVGHADQELPVFFSIEATLLAIWKMTITSSRNTRVQSNAHNAPTTSGIRNINFSIHRGMPDFEEGLREPDPAIMSAHISGPSNTRVNMKTVEATARIQVIRTISGVTYFSNFQSNRSRIDVDGLNRWLTVRRKADFSDLIPKPLLPWAGATA